MLHSGIRCKYQTVLWSMKVSYKVRIFLWLLQQHKLLTKDCLHRRGLDVGIGCQFCNDRVMETAEHLFHQCPYSKIIITILAVTFNLPHITTPWGMVDNWWMHRSSLQWQRQSLWDVVWVGGAWTIWRERNRRIFSGNSKVEAILARDVEIEIQKWLEHV